GLVGLGPRVGEEHPIREGVVAEQLGELGLLRDVEEVRDVEEGRGLLPHRPHHLGMAVPERGHRDAAGEVEVLLAFPVPHTRPPPPRPSPTGLRLAVDIRCLSAHSISVFVSVMSSPTLTPLSNAFASPSAAAHKTISVPIPSLVRTSRRIAWGTRPSMMWAFWAPPVSARRDDSTLGSIPPSITPALISRSASRLVSVDTSRPSSPLIPVTSVKWMSFSAT